MGTSETLRTGLGVDWWRVASLAVVFALLVGGGVLAGPMASAYAADGCGSGSTASIVPDSGPHFDLTDECNAHDDCYGAVLSQNGGRLPEPERKRCDDQFLADMKADCERTYGNLDRRQFACNRTAETYYAAVAACRNTTVGPCPDYPSVARS